jgi:hypothetical protein
MPGGNLRERVGEVGFRVHAVQFRRLQDRVHRGGTLAAGMTAGEEPIASAEGNRPVILPMSGRRSRSNIAGMPSMVAACDASVSYNDLFSVCHNSLRRYPACGHFVTAELLKRLAQDLG